jgi:hypothetical protein
MTCFPSATAEQRARRSKRSEVRFSVDHYSIRQQRAGAGTGYLRRSEARLGAHVLLS